LEARKIRQHNELLEMIKTAEKALNVWDEDEEMVSVPHIDQQRLSVMGLDEDKVSLWLHVREQVTAHTEQGKSLSKNSKSVARI